MVSWREVRDGWQPGKLAELADKLRHSSGQFDRLIDDARGSMHPQSWEGDAADAARSKLRTLTTHAEERVKAGLDVVWRACDEVEPQIWDLKRQVEEAEAIAAAHQFVIDAAGQAQSISRDSDSPADVIATRKRVHSELTERVRIVCAEAESIDEYLHSQLRKAGDLAGIDHADEVRDRERAGVFNPPDGGRDRHRATARTGAAASGARTDTCRHAWRHAHRPRAAS
ncbi:MAG: hypothetical protein ACRDQ7_18775 [Haloechinothrix sp.]